MKKALTLLASLLLLSTMVFGMDFELKHTKLEGIYNFVDTIDGSFTSDTENDWDANVRFLIRTEMDLKEYGKLLMDLDVTKVDTEREFRVIYQRSYGDFEASISAQLIGYKEASTGYIEEELRDGDGNLIKDKDGNVKTVKHKFTSENGETDFLLEPETDDETTYIKYYIFGNRDYALTYYPWYMEIKFDTDWIDDSFEGYNGPGLKYEAKIGKKSKITLETTTLTNDRKSENPTENDYQIGNKHAYAITYETKLKKTSVVAYIGTSNAGPAKEDGDRRNGKREIDNSYKFRTNLTKQIFLTNYLNFNSYDDKKSVQVFSRIDYTMKNKIKNFTPVPYFSIIYKNRDKMGWTDIYGQGVYHKFVDTSACGDLKEIEGGIQFNQGNFSISPRFKISMREKAAYVKYKNVGMIEKNNITVGVRFDHEVWR